MKNRKKYNLALSLLLALPWSCPALRAEDDVSDAKKNPGMVMEAEDFSSVFPDGESIGSETEDENKLETLFHKIQSNFTLLTIKIRNHWDAKVAAIGGLALTSLVFFTLYLRSRGRETDKKIIADLQQKLADEKKRVEDDQRRKELFDDLYSREHQEKQRLVEALRREKEATTRQRSTAEEERSRDKVQLSEQLAKVTSLESQNKELRDRAVLVETQARERLQGYAQQLSEIIRVAEGFVSDDENSVDGGNPLRIALTRLKEEHQKLVSELSTSSAKSGHCVLM